MAKVRVYVNTGCLKCSVVTDLMVSVGPMIFCMKCFFLEFKTLFKKPACTMCVHESKRYIECVECVEEVDSKSKVYRFWLKRYSKMVKEQ